MATLIIAVLLMVAGVEIFKGSIEAVLNPYVEETATWMIAAVAMTMLIKELLARFSRELGMLIDSKALIADFQHHRSDVYTTLMVVAGMIASRLGYLRVDGIMGLLVSVVLIITGYRLAMDAVNPVHVPRNHLVEEALAAAVDGDLGPFDELLAIVRRPFERVPGADRFALPAPASFNESFQAFCGT